MTSATTPIDDVSDERPVILFDGVCNLCNRFVQFIIPRDPDGVFRFAPLQSDVGTALLERNGLPTDELESVVLATGDDCYTKSDAALEIGRRLGGVYRLAPIFKLVPRFVRDRIYDYVAANRYDWFGQKDQCMLPPPDVEERFLAGELAGEHSSGD